MQERLLKVYVTLQGLGRELIAEEDGQDLIEYALVVSLIALAATAGMASVASSLSSAFTNIGGKLSTYSS